MYAQQPPPLPPIEPVFKTVNHLLHLVLTVITCGAWSFVWAAVAFTTAIENSKKQAWYMQARHAHAHAYWQWMGTQDRHEPGQVPTQREQMNGG